VRDQDSLHTHLRPPAPTVDLSCPGLMLAANASLVLGYLWVGWLTDGSRSGLALAVVRGGVLPAAVAIAIFALRPSCQRRGLIGGTLLLPVAGTVEFAAAIAADANSSHYLAMTAGAAALVVAFLAIASVMLRESPAVKRWSSSTVLAATSKVTVLSSRSSARGGTYGPAVR
jgi:hypothetical protein